VLIGRPVALVRTPEVGVPKAGLTRVGDVAKTRAPLPVSSVTAAARFSEDGVPKNVATFVPKPETPVLIGRPVALVRTPEAGVPKAGVTRVGELLRTLLPLPVEVVTPVPPFPTASVPVTPVLKGRPVALVRTPEAGVPKAGVTRVGEVANTRAPLPVSSVTAAARFTEDGVARNVATFVPKPETPVLIGRPVALVRTPEEGVPKAGVTRVGEVANTRAPLPVSSVTAAARFSEDGVPKNVATFVPKPETPVLIGRPVALVRTPEVGVPKAGVIRVGELLRTLLPLPVEVVTPVPPFSTASVPDNVIVPVVVIGLPETVSPVVPPEKVTEVTVPPVPESVPSLKLSPLPTVTFEKPFVPSLASN
jgi:hypothetical protein